jgi:ABC-type multidrug transport system ATPase subunit
VVGLVGENGSGKSTLRKILIGALAGDAGTVSDTGRLGYCPQEPVIYERLTCDEHFELFGRANRMTPESGRSVLIISHFVADEERFDRVVELRDGLARPR